MFIFGDGRLVIKLANATADADEFLAVGIGELFEDADGAGEAHATEFFIGAAALGSDEDVDLAFVGLIEFAADEGFVKAGFEGPHDAGHLGGEDADGALDFANGHGGGGIIEGVDGEVLGFG